MANITPFAETNYRNQRRRFGIQLDDRRRHMYIIGKTGMGKTTLLENMIISDIRQGHGLALIDPHGDFVEKILDYIPASRINDVVYFNPSDAAHPIAFNVLEAVDDYQKPLIASGLVGVFKKIWADSWGPRLEYLMRNTILALLDSEGSTLLGIMRLLVDKTYRKKVVPRIKDPVVRSFWVDEYAKYPDKFQVEAIAPIQNKVGQFLSNALIRNIVGQVVSTVNMRDIMDNQKLLLVNLSKGRVGEDTASLLGAMIITKLQLAAMERVDMPEEQRKDFFLYVDEFQNFATDSFAGILSEARKYRLDLIMAHQYIEQLSEPVAAAVFGNVGTIIAFRVGAEDAEFLEKEFTPRFLATDLVNLTKYDIYLKLMINGVSSDPFSATTMPPLADGQFEGNREKVIRISRERYTTPRDVIEDKIMRWAGMTPPDEEKSAPKVIKGEEKEEELVSTGSRLAAPPPKEQPMVDRTRITCDLCAKEEVVPFKPDPNKPIYCKACLKKVKAEREAKRGQPRAAKPSPERGGAPRAGGQGQSTQDRAPRAPAAPQPRPTPSEASGGGGVQQARSARGSAHPAPERRGGGEVSGARPAPDKPNRENPPRAPEPTKAAPVSAPIPPRPPMSATNQGEPVRLDTGSQEKSLSELL